ADVRRRAAVGGRGQRDGRDGRASRAAALRDRRPRRPRLRGAGRRAPGGQGPVSLVRLELQRGLGRHLRAGHPWVFRRALDKLPKIPPGSVVDLTEGGKFVARGYFDPHSAIAVRVLTLDPREAVDQDFLRARVRRARALREELLDLADTDSHRLIHGE